MTDTGNELAIGARFTADVLEPMKSAFIGKDEVIDLLGVCLVAGENLFILGPPGTAKSALVRDLAERLEGRAFDYLLTRFTEPNELFGPFDIRRLREGELVTNTEGMLPEASFVFLDELLNANSAILNGLLMALNERVFRRGRETWALPALMFVGASNRLPEDDALGAMFDRFLLRVHCDNVAPEQLLDVLDAGWRLETGGVTRRKGVTIEDVRRLNGLLNQVNLGDVRSAYVELVQRLRHAGISISDRRAVKLQRLFAASAVLCGRLRVHPTDFWVMRYIWDREEQQDVLGPIVQDAIGQAGRAASEAAHPRARGDDSPDPERLARDLDRLAGRLEAGKTPETDLAYLRDQLGLLTSRCQWVENEQQRDFLRQKASAIWAGLEQS